MISNDKDNSSRDFYFKKILHEMRNLFFSFFLQAMDYFATSMITTQSINNSTTPLTTNKNNLRRTSRSGLRNSDAWARKRTLMHRGHQWTTTCEGLEEITDYDQYENFKNTASLSDSLAYEDQQNVSSSSTTMLINSKGDLSNHKPSDILRRRRSSRRLPEIPTTSSNNIETNLSDEILFTSSSLNSSSEYPSQPIRENSVSTRSNRSKSIDSDSSLKTRSIHTKLVNTHQSQNAKSVDLSNLTRQKSFLVINNSLLPQRSLDYPYIVRKAQDLSGIVRRRMLYSKISKQQQGENFSLSLEREHVPKVPRKIIIRQDNSIEIALR
jgi:hypothetical protein